MSSSVHWPKTNLDLHIITEPVTAGADARVQCISCFCLKSTAYKPDIFRCICFNCDRIGFYAEIQNICLESLDFYSCFMEVLCSNGLGARTRHGAIKQKKVDGTARYLGSK